MAYIVKWRERSSDSLRQQVCATLKEAEEWRGAVKSMGGSDVAILPQTHAGPARRRKQIQVIDPEGRVWDPELETFRGVEQLASEVNALLRK